VTVQLVKLSISSLMQPVIGGPGSEIPLLGARSDFVAEVDLFSSALMSLNDCRFMSADIRQVRLMSSSLYPDISYSLSDIVH
jgi:hypothetical protein